MAYAGVTYPGGDPGHIQRKTQVGTYTGPRSHARTQAPRVHLKVNVQPPPSIVRYPVTYAGYVPEQFGFSLGRVVKNIGKAVGKGVVDTGHFVGKAATSKVGQLALGTGLALTGVGAPAAAGIFAATKGVGTLIKPGGNLKGAATGAAQGAVEGLVASAAGTAGRAIAGKIQEMRTPDATATAAAMNARAAQAAGVNTGLVTAAGQQYMDQGGAVAVEGPDLTQGLLSPASVQGSITSGSGSSAVGAAQVGATALTYAQERAKAAAQAASEAAAAQGAQVADLQAQLAQAKQMANDAQAASLQQQLDQAKAQAAAAEKAASNANRGATQLMKHGPASSGSDVGTLLQQILQNQNLAQQIPGTPNTPQGTQSLPGLTPVNDGTQPPTAPQEASFGGIPMPVLLLGLGAIVFVSMSGSRSRR